MFHTDKRGVTDIAVNAAKLIKQLGDEAKADGTNIIYEYSPESFMGTETDFAADICAAVMDALGADDDNKVILNLPSTVESSTPNLFADQIEYFCRCLPHRENAIISLHPHNDRGTQSPRRSSVCSRELKESRARSSETASGLEMSIS